MDFLPLSGREHPRFSAIKTFFRLPHVDLSVDFDVAIQGVPFDGGLSYRPGARFAPASIRDISSLGRGYHWNYQTSIFKTLRCADIGDVPIVPISLEQSYQQIEAHTLQVLASGKRVLSVGGDHSITLPILRAYFKHYKKPLNFIHFDAHLDTYPAAWGCEYHHGSFLRHAMDEGLVNPAQTLQFGIRGPFAGADDLEFVNQRQVRVYSIDHIRAQPLPEFLKSLPAMTGPTYISYDIDCLDPAFAPGTGTPVIGGLTTYETQSILRALKLDQVVGGDVVEVSPPYDHASITALAATDAAFEILAQMARFTK